ncbi:hypothetical protein ABPG74_014343 [Tetrahymena malaccensis]
MDQEEMPVFHFKGTYTKVIRNLFDSLAKFTQSAAQPDFHVLVNNHHGLLFITKAKGNITSNIIQLAPEFFNQKRDFNERMSNTPSGFVMKIDLKDFDASYKLLDSEKAIEIKYFSDKAKLYIIQSKDYDVQNPMTVSKVIRLNTLDDTQENLNSISNSFLPKDQFPIVLEFISGSMFKLVEKAFTNLKLEYLVFDFDFTGEEKKLNIENDSTQGDEVFRICLNKFKKIKGESRQYTYRYRTKLIHPAFSFLTKDTEIEMKIDVQGNLFLLSRDDESKIYTETAIPKVID